MKFEFAFTEAEMVVPQCLQLANRFPTFSLDITGLEKCLKASAMLTANILNNKHSNIAMR